MRARGSIDTIGVGPKRAILLAASTAMLMVSLVSGLLVVFATDSPDASSLAPFTITSGLVAKVAVFSYLAALLGYAWVLRIRDRSGSTTVTWVLRVATLVMAAPVAALGVDMLRDAFESQEASMALRGVAAIAIGAAAVLAVIGSSSSAREADHDTP